MFDDVIPKVDNPCAKDCPNRSVTCHGSCEKYNEYNEYNKKIRKRKELISSSIKCNRKVAGA